VPSTHQRMFAPFAIPNYEEQMWMAHDVSNSAVIQCNDVHMYKGMSEMLCQYVAGILQLEFKTFRQEILDLMAGTSVISHQALPTPGKKEPWTILVKDDDDKLIVPFEGAVRTSLQQEKEATPRQQGALVKSILPTSEPHASNTRTGAQWARMAQAIWHVGEVRLKIKTAQKQQPSLDTLEEAFKLICAPERDDADNSCTDGMFEAAQAYNLILTCHALQQSRLVSSALQALRNNVTLRFCCHNGTCNFIAFEAELLRVFGEGRIGSEGYDGDLRSQLFHSFDHLFPGFRQTRKRIGSNEAVQRSPRIVRMHQFLRPWKTMAPQLRLAIRTTRPI